MVISKWAASSVLYTHLSIYTELTPIWDKRLPLLSFYTVYSAPLLLPHEHIFNDFIMFPVKKRVRFNVYELLLLIIIVKTMKIGKYQGMWV